MVTPTARLRSHANVPLYRRAYALMLSGGATSVLGMLYWALATRLFEPEVVGTSSSAIAALTFLAGIAGLSLDGSLIRFLPRAGHATAKLVAYAYVLALIGSAVVAVVFLAGIHVWAPDLAFLRSSWGWIVAAVLATMATCVFTLQDGVLTGLRRTVWVPAENITYALAKILVLLAIAGVSAANGILISFVAPLLLVIAPVSALLLRFIPRHARNTEGNPERVTRDQVVRYASGNYFGFLFVLASLNLPPLLVLNEAGSRASAFFYLPWTIATSLRLLTASVSVSLLVEGTVDRDNLLVHARRAFTHTARLLLPI